MSSPYANLPDSAFWRRSVSSQPNFLVDPVRSSTFMIDKTDAVATAGSCFAQHLSRAIENKGFNYLVTESDQKLNTHEREERNFGVFSARFGNLYTVRQLRQLIERAYGIAEYKIAPWIRGDGRFADPFRPNIEPQGFMTVGDLDVDREAHLKAVRRMFSTLNILVFTMGLTEGWEHLKSGATLPLAPGVTAGEWDPTEYKFKNYNTNETLDDLNRFFEILRSINPSAKMLITVSPVPLIATYSTNSVVSATTYSKSVLRVVAEEFSNSHKGVDYFPSFEIITNLAAGNRYFENDLRSVKKEGVAHVMRCFFKHYVDGNTSSENVTDQNNVILRKLSEKQNDNSFRVVCDEESIENNIM
ncbi:GSCFA domain-containing protein [Rhizobium skierniewicense]|uniref:GSCFA domain-containing protein n=1 Tax=Rhizobium skierniewicense TaxID=984260 RepID=UPI001FAC3C52|nr:GSCFA domain-containing protein [Rhizobium skierniewicense]MCI9868820.1 GSCFA domain-containing protein [Rhizobium skierniewicense]